MIVKRAPYVDLVFGPQTLHRLPDMIRARRQSGVPQVDISFRKSKNSITSRRPRSRGRGLRFDHGRLLQVLFVLRGAVHRGEEISRPFDDVLTEVAGLARKASRKSPCSGRTSMPIAA